ncbi:hypothetical protein JOE21_003165 [Desmospora profundinema]|uniref:N-acetyltransferase domain-containing protein n=1 Tax=Desmospora profundinema TaxID=1571184 RepID=A0ABU1IQU4_9BACL|nr:hypothetical protein [Desmospora profundinema]
MEPDESIRFRPTQESDLPWVLEAEKNEENAPTIICWTHEQHQHTLNDPDKRHWIVEERHAGSMVGFLILAGLDSPHESIELLRSSSQVSRTVMANAPFVRFSVMCLKNRRPTDYGWM